MIWQIFVVVLFIKPAFPVRRIENEGFFRNFSYLDWLDDGNRRLALKEAKDHKITSLPGLSSGNLVQYAGHIEIDTTRSSSIFYWLFENAKKQENAPLIIWLNGGPGCSSMDGLFLELGPLRIDGKSVKLNQYSWHNEANLLFVDQPVGTGLSFTKNKDGYAKNDEMVNEQFYTFLKLFFALHTRYILNTNGKQQTIPIYITGESHAGHYIPTMTAYIMRKNREIMASVDSADLVMDVQGIALGNPWIEPSFQYDTSEFAHGLGILTQGQRNRMREMEQSCRKMLKMGRFNQNVCFQLLDHVIDSSTTAGNHKVLMYDARRYVQSTKSFPPGHDAVEQYLNRADVKQALHAGAVPHRYVECADPPFYALSHQDGKGVTAELAEVLDNGMRVLVYSGQYDIICNHLGSEKALDNLPWKEQAEWLRAQPGVWIADKKPVGYIRQHKNLQSLLVLDAGHMVPMDLPHIALSMIGNFIQGRSFLSGSTKISAIPSYIPEGCPLFLNESAWAPEGTPAPTANNKGGSRNPGKNWFSKKRKTPNRDSAKSDVGAKEGRALSETPGRGECSVSVLHVTPLDAAALVRLRLDCPKARHGLDTVAKEDSIDPGSHRPFELFVEPGARSLRFESYDMFQGAKHSTVEVQVTGLHPGRDYTFSVRRFDEDGNVHLSLKRPSTVRIGCYSPSITQCCHHGECVETSKGSASCRCDGGYSGQFCDYYQAVGNMNISAGAGLCPVHLAPLKPVATHPLSAFLQGEQIKTATAASMPAFTNYCGRGASDSRCCIRAELLIHNAQCSHELEYAQHVEALLQHDVKCALDDVYAAQRINPMTRLITHKAYFGARARQPRDEVLFNHSTHALHRHDEIHPIAIDICGGGSDVNKVVLALLKQVHEAGSKLRSGLITAHLKQHDLNLLQVSEGASTAASQVSRALNSSQLVFVAMPSIEWRYYAAACGLLLLAAFASRRKLWRWLRKELAGRHW